MGRRGTLIIAILCLCGSLVAQQEYSFREIDSISYNATLAGKWDKVINTGKVALEQDIDYFYLRLRMGMAYFYKNNFILASEQFKAAEKFNPDNWLNKSYLYHSCLYSGKNFEAEFYARNMNELIKEEYGIKKKRFLTSLFLETGPEFSNNIDNNSLKKLPSGQSLQYQDLYGNSWYTMLGASLQISPRIGIFTSFTKLVIDKKTQAQYAWNSPDSIVEYEWGFAKYFSSQPEIENLEYDYRLRQNNIYLSANIYAGNGWSLKPAINYIHVNTQSVALVNNSTIVQDTAFYVHTSDSLAYFQYTKINYTLEAEELKLDNVVLSLGIQKRISVFDIGIFGSWSNLYERDQLQYGLSLGYYPLGNLWLYGITTVKGLTDDSESRAIISQMIGGRVFNFMWAEAFGTIGNMKATNESDAFLVYNLVDDIDLKAGLHLIFVVSPSVQLSLRYQYLRKTATRYGYNLESSLNGMRKELNYTNQSIIGGLKWIF